MNWLFVPAPSGKPWTGSTPHLEPLGGSEAAVAFTAQAIAKLGENVWVASHGTAQPSVYYGVTYFNTQELPEWMKHNWDVVVVSRWVDVTHNPWMAKALIFWSHDMPQQFPINLNAHALVFLTKFHAASWHMEGPNVGIIGDGVEMSMFDNLGDLERDPNKVIWASNPDRGLPLACHIFQKVRKRWPDLELHVFGRSAVYGWDANAEAPFLPRPEDSENVFMHDPLPRYALAKELKTAWAYFYPTWWPETFCMATLEAQAAGTPVICSPLAALNETVKGGILTYDYVNAFSQLRNKRRWEKLSVAGVEWARQNTWKIRAQEWITLAKRVAAEADIANAVVASTPAEVPDGTA